MQWPAALSRRRLAGPALFLAAVAAAVGGLALAYWAGWARGIIRPELGGWLALLSAGSLVIAVVVAIDAGDSAGEVRDTAAMASFAAVAPILSLIVAFLTVAFYVAGASGGLAIVGALASVLVGWVVLAVVSQRSITAARVRPGTYNELRERYQTLREILLVYEGQPYSCVGERVAMAEARAHADQLRDTLGLGGGPQPAGLRWMNASAYMDSWNHLHRAEEALIELMPIGDVRAQIEWERDRLSGSTIESRGDMLMRLKEIEDAIVGSATRRGPTPGQPCRTDEHAGGAPATGPKLVQRFGVERARLRNISRTINDFRDERWRALALARNRLNRTGIFTGIVAYAVLCLLLLLSVPIAHIATGALLYLVGAIAGLFGRLASEVQSNEAVEDYGLTCARMMQTPLFSGIAALGGVALVALVPAVLQPPVDSASITTVATLDNVFGSVRLADLAIAATFGLTPALLINRLQSQAERYKADLRKSEAAGTDL